MKLLKFSVFFLMTLLLFGCVTRAVQTEALLSAHQDLPKKFEIKEVPFIDQSVGYCGPATLTMVMNWAGQKVSVNEVAAQVYTPGLKGSFQADMISASRRQGLMAVPIQNLSSLLREVSAGHPVVIFENLSVSWAPQWHYAVVLGFDIEKQEVIMHSGHDAFYHWDMSKFERSWMLGEYWGLVVLPAGELAVAAGEMDHVKAAVGLEQSKKDTEAEKSYQKILQKWPDNLVSLIGLANLAYKNGNPNLSVDLLKRAIKAHPDSEAAKHNLAVAQGKK